MLSESLDREIEIEWNKMLEKWVRIPMKNKFSSIFTKEQRRFQFTVKLFPPYVDF
jgi:hypothetical protein